MSVYYWIYICCRNSHGALVFWDPTCALSPDRVPKCLKDVKNKAYQERMSYIHQSRAFLSRSTFQRSLCMVLAKRSRVRTALNYTCKTGFTKVLVIYKLRDGSWSRSDCEQSLFSSDFNRWASLASNKANWSGRWKGKFSKKRQTFLQWWNTFAFEVREHNP